MAENTDDHDLDIEPTVNAPVGCILLALAGFVARERGVALDRYLDDVLRPKVTADYKASAERARNEGRPTLRLVGLD